jgi:hypothetical protein
MAHPFWHLLVCKNLSPSSIIVSEYLGLTCFLSNSCFNAFSRVDVRVEVKIPGGVESYVVDTNGER